jgi:hypothetical protein
VQSRQTRANCVDRSFQVRRGPWPIGPTPRIPSA